MKVVKFGGSSVRDAAAMKRCAQILASEEEVGMAILSATYNTTNELEEIAFKAVEDVGQSMALLERLLQKHVRICVDLNVNADVVAPVFEQAISLIEEIKEHSLFTFRMDLMYSIGERLSTLIFSEYLKLVSTRTIKLIDSTEFIKTDNNHNCAEPNLALIKEKCRNLSLRSGTILVAQGFIGSDEKDAVTTLGREGSDYSATLYAYGLGASEVNIWTDVEGIFSVDPKLYSEAKVVPELGYHHAELLCEHGAKVLYSKTMGPCTENKIPIWVGSSETGKLGTVIKDGVGQKPVVGISVIKMSENTQMTVVGDDIKLSQEVHEEGKGFRQYLVEHEEVPAFLDAVHKLI